MVSLREIPDKPPPPYTPPSSPSSKVLRLRLKDPEIIKYVPSSKDQVFALCNDMSKLVFQLHESLKNTDNEDETFFRKLMELTLPEEILEV